MPIGDIVQLNLILSNTNNPDIAENTFHFKRLDDVQSFSDLASEFDITCLQSWMNEMNLVARCSLIQVRDVVPGTGAGFDFTVSPSKQGSKTNDVLPPQDAAVITWRTGLAGRSYRGRSYVPYQNEGEQNAGVLAGGALTSLTTAAQAILTQYGPTGVSTHWRACVLSRRLNGAIRPVPVGTNIVGFVVRSTIRSQRRRQLGRGS